MKLIIQIPCLNESKTLHLVLRGIPKSIPGIKKIEVLVIDDGSEDLTHELAQKLGVDHIIRNPQTLGLGNSFRIGMDYSYRIGADLLVNTDGDNQYPSENIPELIAPLLEAKADMVIGNRNTAKIKHFSIVKKFLQALGTKVVQTLVRDKELKDAVSGFRAYNRYAMSKINVTSSFSYVLDTTIQAKIKGIRMVSVDIRTNPPTRPSRLFRSNFQHVRKSSMDIIRIYAMYKAMRVFFWIGIVLMLIGLIPMVRFLIDYFWGSGGAGKIQSLIIGSTFILSSVIMFALGIIADLLGKNRMLIERLLEKEKNQ